MSTQNEAQAEQSAQQEPVAWLDGPHLVMRSDWRDRANYKGPWVDFGRAIPDSWVPVLYTTPQAQPAQQSAVRGEPNHVEDVLAMVEPKIGCVNHDCDKCKAEPERKTYYGDRIILGQGGEPNIVIPEGMKNYTPPEKPKGNP